MWRLILAFLASFALTLALQPVVIPALRRLHFRQTIYDLGPQSHKSKQGTPVMGGLMIAAGLLIGAVIGHAGPWRGRWDFSLALLGVSFLSMLVGFADDFIKAVKKRHEGLTPWQKIAGQVIVSLAFSAYCYVHPQVGSVIRVPFAGVEWDLGVFYIPLMTLLMIFMINSANLQDGLDGLMGSVTSVGASAWAAVALTALLALRADGVQGDNLRTAAAFALALAGGAMAFLKCNYYPAKVFMGDTGSMLIGGAMVGLAMLLREPLLLLLICFTMVMSSASVIIQRFYFKLTHGKRIFRMSPIHHHFELGGMKETQIDTMYAVISAVCAIIAVLSEIGV